MRGKSKAKLEINGNIIKAKLKLHNLMSTKEEAESKSIPQDCITHITVYVGERLVFDFKPTGNIAENPYIKFKFKRNDIQEGDVFTMKWTSIVGGEEEYISKVQTQKEKVVFIST
jgi:hypothetical protein